MTVLDVYNVLQSVLVGLLVLGCAFYCVMRFAPSRLTTAWRDQLRRSPLAPRLSAQLASCASQSACGTSCQGCSPRAPEGEKTVQWHPRRS